MTYHPGQPRKAMTAIAAVVAFSSTPLLAQNSDPVADTALEQVAADPLSPAPEATQTVTESATEPEATAAPPAPRPRVETARSDSSRPAARRAPSAVRSAAPVPAATPVAATPAAPAPVAEAQPVASPVAPAPTEARVTSETPTTIEAMVPDELVPDDMIPVAGGAALGLLGIGGIALAMRRRKRRKDEDEMHAAKWAAIEAGAEPEAQAEPGPTFVRAAAPVPVRAAVPVNAPATKLPNGFDISRFGPHVQAAYRGPTPDNPSLSLKNRLRRASFFDQQERRASQEAAAKRPAEAPAKTGWAEPNKAEFMLRRAEVKSAPKPALHN